MAMWYGTQNILWIRVKHLDLYCAVSLFKRKRCVFNAFDASQWELTGTIIDLMRKWTSHETTKTSDWTFVELELIEK